MVEEAFLIALDCTGVPNKVAPKWTVYRHNTHRSVKKTVEDCGGYNHNTEA